MYIHSVKLINYKSIGDYDESKIILEPRITAIIGKNESGKSNLLEGLSVIDFLSFNLSSYAPEKKNRAAEIDSSIGFEIIIKPNSEDIEKGIVEDTKVHMSAEYYEMTGGLLFFYIDRILPLNKSFLATIDSIGGNPFNLKNQDFTAFKIHVSELQKTKYLNVPVFLTTLKYFRQKVSNASKDIQSVLTDSLRNIEEEMEEFLAIIPHFFYRQTTKRLKTSYSFEEIEKELLHHKSNSSDLLYELVSLIDVPHEEFLLAAKAGKSPQQLTLRKRITKLISERINAPFQNFYTTEVISLDAYLGENSLAFTIQSADGDALAWGERSNGLRWYLETFIDAQAHNVLKVNTVYLFDEPGVYLHVNAQRELIRLFQHLSSKGNQIVYTTHSPYMLDVDYEGIHRIRPVVKDNLGYTRIYKTAYDPRIATVAKNDTLAPIISALGMSLNHTFGPAKDKINIVTEGISDYIYFCMMAKVLNIDSNKYAIIPSVGAANIVNICSILQGWGCNFIAVFDYDKAGVETGGQYMTDNLLYEKDKQYCYLIDVSEDDIKAKTYKTSPCLIEDIITQNEIDNFISTTGTSNDLGKALTAKFLSNAVECGRYSLGQTCIDNFRSLFDRIISNLDSF